MADVVQKVISANVVKNGSALATVNKQGTTQTVDPEILTDDSLTRTENRLTGRFDDTSYYSS